RYAVYQLTVEPDLWPMKRDRNLRIFQGQTVPQIVKTLLGEHQVNLEDKLTGSYRVWDYCVQYQESSLDFISRLMELEGIAYHFSHEADKHTLVLTDAATQHQPFSGYEVIPYHQTPSGGSTDEEGISQWALEDSVTPGIYSLDDYDFRKPNAWLFQAQQNPASPKPGSIDVYDWPGRFVETGHAEFYARIRQERWQVEHQQIQATATAAGIAPGHIFTLTNAPFFSDNGEYLVTAAGYHFEENRYASGEGETIHRTDFTVIPAAVSYRPAQSTAWPRTYGPQTAKVVGPQGESIWTDKYGRVKVKFHWDRLAKGDDTSSCWVRVSSAWAGQGYGGVQIPRVGDEVVVDFINGDPDRPIITGRVYNEASMPPWALPAAATQMGFMSRTKDGSVDNANALRFEDKAGAEQVWIQAERNMDTSVKNDETHSVGGARSHYVKKNELHRVEANQIQAVKGGTEILTGRGKLDAAVEQYVIASGTKLRLVSGESAIELNANGKINLIGKEFNFFVEGDGYITTGGKLHLNTSGTKPGTTAPGSGHKGDIDAAVQEKFAPGKESKAGAAASAPAETSKTATPPSSGVPSSGYGKDVDGLVDKSPTMKNDIATLKKRGWTFEEGEAGKGTFANRQTRVITVDKNELGNPKAVVQSLSHESGHALYEPNIDVSSRDAYLNSALSDEGAATLNNIRVQREILANKGGDIGIAGNPANQTQYNRIYDSLERGAIKESEARTQIGRIFGKGEQTSTTGQYYEDYYGGWYDKNYP
ncbi:TPA: type VI secretion system Vgr family protein, partial [Enterobacter hormaechei]|nr:type VI secretion system tip protein VgrG [Enterobacter hormaechei subsp. hoffmannii]HCJ7633023.1 type VI secretion system tip protein VgrG [Enterobacter hormaechei subsp. xiangfangensis]